jgi:hypothetical protein
MHHLHMQTDQTRVHWDDLLISSGFRHCTPFSGNGNQSLVCLWIYIHIFWEGQRVYVMKHELEPELYEIVQMNAILAISLKAKNCQMFSLELEGL